MQAQKIYKTGRDERGWSIWDKLEEEVDDFL